MTRELAWSSRVDTTGKQPIQAGHVLGVASPTWLDMVINLWTLGIPGWSLSHLAIVAKHPEDGRLLVFESTTQNPTPCLFAGKSIDGWQAHELEEWLQDRVVRRGARVWHYPLAQPLCPFEEERLTSECMQHLGKPYDSAGALAARTLCFGWLFHIIGHYLPNRENLDNLFCSEGVGMVLRPIGRFLDGNASRWNPNHMARVLRRWGILLKPAACTQEEV